MPIDAVITLVLGTLIIAAAALGLMRVIGHLASTSKTLGTLDGGVKVIVDQTSTFGGLRTEIEEAVDPEGDIRGSMKFDTDWSDDDLIDYSDPEFADDNTMQPSADEESAVEKSESEHPSAPSPPDAKEASGDKPVSTEPPKGDAADGDSKTGGSA